VSVSSLLLVGEKCDIQTMVQQLLIAKPDVR